MHIFGTVKEGELFKPNSSINVGQCIHIYRGKCLREDTIGKT